MKAGEWQKVKFADECTQCEYCGEPWCEDCNDHYAECSCIGPTQGEEYEYSEDGLRVRIKEIP